MDAAALKKFIYSPYNKVADIKMFLFFTDISEFALWTLGILILFSVVIKNFWCRYLCPYGALLGFLSMFSPVKVTRNAATCTDCKKCTAVCPNSIIVHNKTRIISDECTACALCIDICPAKETLQFKTGKKSRPVPVRAFGLTIVLFFLIGTSFARITGYWHNSISDIEYNRRIQEISNPVYDHNRGSVPDYGPED
jgi:polyferredoxin